MTDKPQMRRGRTRQIGLLDLDRQRQFLRCGAAQAIHPEEMPRRSLPEARDEPASVLDCLA